MLIGVARHFRIPHDRLQMLDGSGFDVWAEWYDTTEVRASPVPPAGPEWQRCLCSDLPRAVFTANTLFQGPIEVTPVLREVPFSAFLPRRLKLPLLAWQATSRVGWWLDHAAQRETRSQTKRRIADFVARLLAEHRNENVLLVTHGFLMQWLQKELIAAGFRGKLPIRPMGGTIYRFRS